MKITDIRKLPTEELAKQSVHLREEIAELRRRVRIGELHNVRMARAKRKDLARILTVLGEQLREETK